MKCAAAATFHLRSAVGPHLMKNDKGIEGMDVASKLPFHFFGFLGGGGGFGRSQHAGWMNKVSCTCIPCEY